MQCPEAAHVRVLSESPGMLGPSGELGRPCPAHRHGLQLNVTPRKQRRRIPKRAAASPRPAAPPPTMVWGVGGGAVLAALQAQRAGPGRVWFPETPPRPPRLPSLSKTGPPKKCPPPRSNWRSPALRPAAPLPAASQSRFASLLSAAPGRRPLRPRLPCPPTAARGRPARNAARPTRRKPTCSPLKRKPCFNPTERTLSKKRSDAGCK